METLRDLLGNRILFFDGGTGSVLQGQGLKPGELPETWNILHPERITALHHGYFAAGCNIIKTNTFGANALKFPSRKGALSSEGTFAAEVGGGFFLEDVVSAALRNAHEARRRVETERIGTERAAVLRERRLMPRCADPSAEPHFVALDIGPVGKLLEPLGDLTFDEAVSAFYATVRAAVAPEENEFLPDLILIETMNDCYEAKAAVVAAKEAMEAAGIDLPLFVTTVYDESGKSLTGSDCAVMATVLEGLGVDALGMNCGLGPLQMAHILPRLVENTSLPVVMNPNAGLPRSKDGATVYDVSPEEFARIAASFVDAGASVVGGCCGTTPEHICRLVDSCRGKECPAPRQCGATRISSATRTVTLGGRPVLVGERINPTGKKRFKQALRENDLPYILQEGLSQEEKGVHVLDVNVGLPEIDEPAMLEAVVKELQGVTSLPLQLDTSDVAAMERAMRVYNGKPLINSVNGKQEVMDAVFPLVKKYGGVVVALTLDEGGIPETVEGRLGIAEKIYAAAASYGISRKDIVVDSLAMAVSSDTNAALATLGTLKAVHESGGRTILGVSNISFGLPQRELITAEFFTMAMQCGLSAAIMNPGSLEMMKAYTCFCTLSGYDENCAEYISFAQEYRERFPAERPASAPPMQGSGAGNGTGGAASAGNSAAGNGTAGDSLVNAVVRGLKSEAARLARKLLSCEDAVAIINNRLIPALDIVGKGFEAKTLYLPQLLMSAEAAKAAFAVTKETLAAAGKTGESKGRIVLATVKGDIHDIGKNIVKVLLENYGFTVIDLGKDVEPQAVVQAVLQNDVKLVGLSALMTTTVPSMEATIKLLRREAPGCMVCVGGAVLTQEYADMIGADFYARDALETVKFAQRVLPQAD